MYGTVDPVNDMMEPSPNDWMDADAAEAAAVRTGWLLVDAHERLGIGYSAIAFAGELAASYAHARATVADLLPWRGAGPKARAMYQNDTNRYRFRRILDFVNPGDRIFDIGLGRGYLGGLLLRDSGIASYTGIDIDEKNVIATRSMADANGFAQYLVDVSVGDLFDLDAERIARSGADLVICCEVLEHLIDPERALNTLAKALPDGVELLISAPMYGRLDTIWGHVSMFDATRLKALIETAGLYLHHIEPICNAWTLLLLSHDPSASRRAQTALAQRPGLALTAHAKHQDWVMVDLAEDCVAFGAAGAEVELGQTGVVCRVGDGSRRSGVRRNTAGGVAFPVAGLHGLRLEFGFLDLTQVNALSVDGYAGANRVGRWSSTPVLLGFSEPKKTFVLRPSQSNRYFIASGFANGADADRVEITLTTKARGNAAFELRRAAYLC
jgi:SAM-dependent methyltransferase